MAKSDERNLFREYVRDVKPLVVEERHTSRPKPSPVARFTRADRREVLRESLLPPQDETLLCTGDELSFRRPHVPERILTKLRRGHYVVDAEIDLHGLTAAEARGALREFIGQALQRRFTCVRVVHGKGRRSGPRGPVLKNVVNLWLQRSDAVLAFGSARAVDGGSGAVYVLLRR
ncbi:MAG: Smr/MutS family protein [Gammaproteobacteria bacterium]|nr:DNA mismatch repair protein MutS [Gammaproteobacteria bacterium]